MSVEKFETRRLTGKLNVVCKFDDGTQRTWAADKAQVVADIVRIVNQYSQMGYRLTLRQLHYQFVGHSAGYVNHQTAYKKLGTILDDCRYGGVIDWDAIEDRGRVPHLPYWVHNMQDALQDTIAHYRLNLQAGQANHVEVWSEKDALSNILRRSTDRYHVRLCINKGHSSSSAMYRAYERFSRHLNNGQQVTILYFGDHDPSGLDMVRDIDERLRFMFTNGDMLYDKDYADSFEVRPIGLNMKQIKKYKLPPNPTKSTDSRSNKYIAEYGEECWEVDALRPEVLTELVNGAIESSIDMAQYQAMLDLQAKDIKKLRKFVNL